MEATPPTSAPTLIKFFSRADIDISDLDLVGKISFGAQCARGGYSDIAQGTLHTGGGDVKIAIKVLRVRGGNDSSAIVDRLHKHFYREILLWRTLQHPNVVPLLGYAMLSDQSPTLVSPWYTNGNVNEYLKSHENADRGALVRKEPYMAFKTTSPHKYR
ncbi:hypothetical protein FRC03_001242 [Tulasnella sp. 419]|nr:hypothetical protein FRC03_001242 [Tulasnella sp. 419]